MHPTLNIALRAANSAAEKMIYTREHWPTLVDESGVEATLTNMVEGAAKRVFNTVRKAHPDQTVICEQTDAIDTAGESGDVHWQASVLVGEDNYRRGLSDCGVIVSQWHKNRMEHLTLVFPFLSLEIMASRGRGVQINGRRVRAGKADRLTGSFSGTTMAAQTQLKVLSEAGSVIRISGCAVLDFCRVAAGHLDIAAHDQMTALEVSAAQLLATESGAVTGDFSGAPVQSKTQSLISANPRLFKAVMVAMRQA